MKIKLLQIITLSLLFLTICGCDSYIAFEKMRYKFFIYVFFGSLIIGLIGMLLSNKSDKK